MFLTRFALAVRRRVRGRPTHGIRGLYSAAELAAILQRERARTDRSGEVFSVLAFALPKEHRGPATPRRLAWTLKRRLRSTDELGWLDEERIGAVLPSTPPQGAWTVAADICGRLPPGTAQPHCTVYCYPRDAASGKGDSREDTIVDETHQEDTARGSNGKSPGKARPDRTVASRPIVSMDRLFVLDTPLWKRCLDVLGAGAGIVLLSPVMGVLAVAVKLTSPGPVLFSQTRSGLGGKPFVMYKFRSMIVDAEARKSELRRFNQQDGPAFKMADDPRVTRLGRLLRRTNLDELPQLWNVLKGEMSLVGPRPLPCDESEACERWHQRRLDVTPGLTCTWQVRGRPVVTFAEWVRMDIRYIRARSMRQDLKLILRTIPAIVLRRKAK